MYCFSWFCMLLAARRVAIRVTMVTLSSTNYGTPLSVRHRSVEIH